MEKKEVITVVREPFDAHLHLRDLPLLNQVIGYSVKQFAGALIMPNLNPPVVTTKEVAAYRERIVQALGSSNVTFKPYMTTYLTDQSDRHDVRIGFNEGVFISAKLYPPHGTTNSAYGVSCIEKIYPVLEVMQEIGMVLCVHGEMPPNSGVDIFDREKYFLSEKLYPLVCRFPKLKIVFEHVTTKDACDFVINNGLQATVTPQHLLLSRNALFDGGLHPELYCMPILKKDIHTKAIQEAVISGNPHFGLGTDSAPHLNENKYKSCGCAGVFSAPVALESYFGFFYENNIVDKFQTFVSDNMMRFYGIDLPMKNVEIQAMPDGCEVASNIEGITPFKAGEKIYWKAV